MCHDRSIRLESQKQSSQRRRRWSVRHTSQQQKRINKREEHTKKGEKTKEYIKVQVDHAFLSSLPLCVAHNLPYCFSQSSSRSQRRHSELNSTPLTTHKLTDTPDTVRITLVTHVLRCAHTVCVLSLHTDDGRCGPNSDE